MQTPQDVIAAWSARAMANAAKVAKLEATYKFIIGGKGGGSWLLRCRSPVSMEKGEGPADCTISMDAADFVALGNGELNPQMAFMSGRLNVEGDLELALRLSEIVEES